MDKREEMVNEIRRIYGLDSPRVLEVMLQIPREKFVPYKYRHIAYEDCPVPIGFGQTMSQPYTVAFMTHLLISQNSRYQKVLEIGTGSGYQAAVLSRLFKEVYTVEIIPQLAERARKILKRLGFKNVYVRVGSGEWGWEEEAPFDAIIVTAGIKSNVPKPLFEQLKVKGVLVAPIGSGGSQIMTRFTKEKGGRIKKEEFGVFHFVPFIEEKN